MFAETLATAIALAPKRDLDALARQLWQAHSAGIVDDDTAQELAEQLAERQRSTPPPVSGARTQAFSVALPKRRVQRSPDRQRSIERRRRLAASGPMPPALAAHFSTGELAVLRIVADEIRLHGCCGLHIDAIAARAGVSHSTVQRALREARLLGLITVQERRRAGCRSLTNIVRVISQQWRIWLKLADKGGMHHNPPAGRQSGSQPARLVRYFGAGGVGQRAGHVS